MTGRNKVDWITHFLTAGIYLFVNQDIDQRLVLIHTLPRRNPLPLSEELSKILSDASYESEALFAEADGDCVCLGNVVNGWAPDDVIEFALNLVVFNYNRAHFGHHFGFGRLHFLINCNSGNWILWLPWSTINFSYRGTTYYNLFPEEVHCRET